MNNKVTSYTEIDCENWEDFNQKLQGLYKIRQTLKTSDSTFVSPLLFRGHANKDWPLLTTLERYTREHRYHLQNYFNLISAVKPQIETITGKTWDMYKPQKFNQWLQRKRLKLPLPGYEFMVYLRHHGFPSPLLDWTHSPEIAAYFAFNNITFGVKKVSVYAYLENAGREKSSEGGKPKIETLGPYVKSHERHFLQQCEYSICSHRDGEEWFYENHGAVWSEEKDGQDLLWVFDIPSTERLKVLKHLDRININSFSLFRSDESLMETMALREFFLKKTDFHYS